LGSKIRIMTLARGPVSPYVKAAVDGVDFPNSSLKSF